MSKAQSFDEWLDEFEGYATRRERFYEDVDRGSYGELKLWLKTAFRMGEIYGRSKNK